ncbi:hypothetical protein KUTeg_006094 [Tegillarca granosa]|uniref:Uncharacterized protein n=1 Tax=Tegillarca granosa TaxID=220873 RepID=A0ABQ9FK78_TEGGR|nr:hypothetical protein KUTeg_006094 [Tegillarca granosa]
MELEEPRNSKTEEEDLRDQTGRSSKSLVHDRSFDEQRRSESVKDNREESDNESVKKENLLHPELSDGTPRNVTPRHERFSAGRINTRASASSVYAVANPAVLVAQGDTPTQQNVQFTPRVDTANKKQNQDIKTQSEDENLGYGSVETPSSRKSAGKAVSFGDINDSDLNRGSPSDGEITPTNWDTPRKTDIQERVPTPHPSSPQKSPVKFQEEFNSNSLENSPVISPEPVDTYNNRGVNSASSQKRSSRIPSGRESSKLKSEKSVSSLPTVKRVYIDSPTFTKEEENEYRFVESRLETGNEDLENTFRELENSSAKRKRNSAKRRNSSAKRKGSSGHRNRRDKMDDSYGAQQEYQQRGGNQDNRYDDQRDNRDGNYGDRYERREESRDNDQYDRRSNPSRDNDQYDRRSNPPRDNDQYDRRSNPPRDDDQYDRRSNPPRDNDQYDRQSNPRRDNDQYDRQSNPRRDNDARENNKDRRQSDNRYEDRRHKDDRYDDRDRYSDERYRNRDRYEDRNEQMDDSSHGQYRQQERGGYDRRREDDEATPTENYRRVQRYNTNMDEDLEREREYQDDLQHRISSQSKKDSQIVIPKLPLHVESEDYVQDSLDYDSGANNNWGNPPQNPYGGQDERYNQQQAYHHRQQQYINQQQQQQQQQQNYQPRQRGVQEFVDQLDTARIEFIDPSKAKYDYVENNKVDYGRPHDKNYKTIVQKRKEAEEKLEKIFISPKTKSKQQRQLNKGNDNQYFSPLADFHNEHQMSSAEEMWAQRSAALSKKKSKTASGTIQKKQGLQKYPSDSGLFRVPGQSNGVRMYGTPTRNHFLEPLGQRPQPPQNDAFNREPPSPPQFQPQQSRSPPFKKPLELKPITQQIVTEDGQRISVDINLKVVSPPPPHSQIGGPPQIEATVIPRREISPERHRTGQQYPLPYFRNEQSQAELMTTYNQYEDPQPLPPAGFQQQQQPPPPQYGSDVNMENNQSHYQEGYYGYDNNENIPPPRQKVDGQPQFNDADYAHPNYNPYNTIPPIGEALDSDQAPEQFDENGYAAIYKRDKEKDPNEQPWYQVYTIKDYRRMVKELEKRYKQIDYARMVMEKNRQEYGDRKPPPFPKPKEQHKEETKRRNALSPINKRKSPVQKVPQQTIDVIDLKKLQQRHEQDKQNVASIKQKIEA